MCAVARSRRCGQPAVRRRLDALVQRLARAELEDEARARLLEDGVEQPHQQRRAAAGKELVVHADLVLSEVCVLAAVRHHLDGDLHDLLSSFDPVEVAAAPHCAK